MTGEVATDTTMVSAAGLTDGRGSWWPSWWPPSARPAPPVLAPDTVAGVLLRRGPAAELGLAAGVPVVVGAGDRACEVLGTAASPDRPMVSWGTTANVSVPVEVFPGPSPTVWWSPGGHRGLAPGGRSLGRRVPPELVVHPHRDRCPDVLMAAAGAAPVGAHGVVALPWFGGARAPWWRARARGGFVGLSFDHDAGDLARAVVEVGGLGGPALSGRRRRAVSATRAGPHRGPGTEDRPPAPWPSHPHRRHRTPGRPVAGRVRPPRPGPPCSPLGAVGADYDLDQLDPGGGDGGARPVGHVDRYAERRAGRGADAVAWRRAVPVEPSEASPVKPAQ
jgi:hypothetical protein